MENPMKNKPLKYELNCYARPEGNHVVAVCLELFLVAKGRNLEEAKFKLLEQMHGYIDCLDDKNFNDLFPRKAPLGYYIEYRWVQVIVLMRNFFKSIHDTHEYFKEILRPKNFTLIPA